MTQSMKLQILYEKTPVLLLKLLVDTIYPLLYQLMLNIDLIPDILTCFKSVPNTVETEMKQYSL